MLTDGGYVYYGSKFIILFPVFILRITVKFKSSYYNYY